MTNWAGVPNITALNVTISVPAVRPGMKATLASGGKVVECSFAKLAPSGVAVTFTLDLDVADALILRP